MKMLISTEPKSEVYLTLIALTVNLALNPRCAESMCESTDLQNLVQRALAYQDSLIMKVIRNLSKHPTTHNHFLVSTIIRPPCYFPFYVYSTYLGSFMLLTSNLNNPLFFKGFADEFLKVLPTCSDEEFLLETTGTLANLPLCQIDISQLLHKHDVLPWIDDCITSCKCHRRI